MKVIWKSIVSLLFYILGVVGWCYIGGWMVITKPLKGLILAHAAGSLSLGKLLMAMLQGFVYLSLAGGIWCIGYMLSNYFRDDN